MRIYSHRTLRGGVLARLDLACAAAVRALYGRVGAMRAKWAGEERSILTAWTHEVAAERRAFLMRIDHVGAHLARVDHVRQPLANHEVEAIGEARLGLHFDNPRFEGLTTLCRAASEATHRMGILGRAAALAITPVTLDIENRPDFEHRTRLLQLAHEAQGVMPRLLADLETSRAALVSAFDAELDRLKGRILALEGPIAAAATGR